MRRNTPPLGSALCLALALTGLLASGCQSKSDPSAPPDPEPAATNSGASALSGIAPLGMADLTLDFAAGTAALKPVAMAQAVGDAYAVDATSFFTSSPCVDCMKITGFGRDGAQNALRVDVELTHPFPDRTKRKDLDVFDARVIAIHPMDTANRDPRFWTYTPGADTDADGTDEQLSGNTQFLLNADGYTTHFDKRAEEILGVAMDGNLNPFINYYSAASEIPFIRNPNHRFRQDADPETQPFLFYYPTGAETLQVYLVLEVAYGQSALKATRLIPSYFVPEFNMKEAYKVEAEDITNSLTSVPLSGTTIRVEIADWQSPAPVDANYPNFAQPGSISSSSGPTQVWIESTDLAPNSFNTVTQLAGIGSESDPAIFEVTISNIAGVGAGTYPALLTVRDSRDGLLQTIDGANLGFTRDVRAYRIISVTVYDPTTFKPVLAPNLVNLPLGVQHGSPPYANASAGRGDIAVYNDGGTSSGVLIPAATGDVVHYRLDYTAPTVYAPGRKPFDDYATAIPPRPHPAPGTNMPIDTIDAADDGSFAITFSDDNFTFDPNGLPGSTLTRALPMRDFVAYSENDNGLVFPAPRFIGGCGSDCLDPPICDIPAYGERIINVWDSPASTNFRDVIGYLSGGQNTERCGVASLDYFVFGSPYQSTAQKQVSGNGNLWIDTPPATFFLGIKAIDAGSIDTDGSQNLYALIGNDIYYLDQLEGLNTSTRVAAPTSFTKKQVLDGLVDIGLETVDIQVLESSRVTKRNMNGVGQTSDWIVVLYRDQSTGQGLLRIFETTNFSLLQELDGRGAPSDMESYVTAVDVDDNDYTIHVAMDDNGAAAGGNYKVSVFSLQP